MLIFLMRPQARARTLVWVSAGTPDPACHQLCCRELTLEGSAFRTLIMGTNLPPDFWLSLLSAAKSHNAPLEPQEASERAEHRGTPISRGASLPFPVFAQGTIRVPGKDGRSPKRREGVLEIPQFHVHPHVLRNPWRSWHKHPAPAPGKGSSSHSRNG